MMVVCNYFFFFSSRRRHTRLQGDWSSDVCSSDLIWRFAQDGDTLDYRETRGGAPVLEAEWRREGEGFARSRTEFDAQRVPARAPMDFPEERARFELTVVSGGTAAVRRPARSGRGSSP